MATRQAQKPPNKGRTFITGLQDIGKHLGVSRPTAHKMVRQGALKGVVKGGDPTWWAWLDDVETWCKSKEARGRVPR